MSSDHSINSATLRRHPISAAKPELSPHQMGRGSDISGFESLRDAEHWIATEAQDWLNALNTQL
jgi:hypothetical protein